MKTQDINRPLKRINFIAHLAADALNACLARAGADIGSFPIRAVVASDAIAQKLKRLLRAPQVLFPALARGIPT